MAARSTVGGDPLAMFAIEYLLRKIEPSAKIELESTPEETTFVVELGSALSHQKFQANITLRADADYERKIRLSDAIKVFLIALSGASDHSHKIRFK